MGFHSFLVPLQDVQGDPIQSPGNPSQALFSPGALQPGTPRPPQFPQLCRQPRGSLSLRFILQINLTFPFDSVSPEISEPEGQGETLLKDRGGQGPGKDAGMGLQWQVQESDPAAGEGEWDT